MPENTLSNEGFSRLQRLVINRAFDHFHATGVWPLFGQLDRPLYNEEQIDLVQVLRSIPNELVHFDRNSPQTPFEAPIQLSLKAIAMCVGSESDLSLYFEALRWFAIQESHTPATSESIECEVTRQGFLNYLSTTSFGSFWTNASKVASLILVEGGLYRSSYSQSPDGEWTLRINRNIRYFKEVHNLHDYNNAMERLLESLNARNAYQVPASHNLDDFAIPETHTDADATLSVPHNHADRYVFIVMPFNEPWSGASHNLIKMAIDRVPSEPKLRSLRSDEITTSGDITEQIIEAINGAILVLSDITSTKLRKGCFSRKRYVPNANVMWELGYSMAREALGFGAPNVLINQDPKYAPFDLSHLRQMQYSVEANEAEIERLANVIAANLP